MKTIRTILALGLIGVLALGCKSEMEMVTVPKNTPLIVELETTLSTEMNMIGDRFESHSMEPLTVDGETIIPEGTTFRGTITELDEPDEVGGSTSMTLVFSEVVDAEGNIYGFKAAPIALVGKSDSESDIERVVATTVAGALIGGIAKGGKGAAVGAVAGAGVGGTWAVLTKGEHIVLERGLRIEINTANSFDVPILTE